MSDVFVTNTKGTRVLMLHISTLYFKLTRCVNPRTTCNIRTMMPIIFSFCYFQEKQSEDDDAAVLVKIFVEFKESVSAKKAKDSLHGR